MYGKMLNTMYFTVQLLVQGTWGSTVLKCDIQHKWSVKSIFLKIIMFISRTSCSCRFEKYLTSKSSVSSTQVWQNLNGNLILMQLTVYNTMQSTVHCIVYSLVYLLVNRTGSIVEFSVQCRGGRVDTDSKIGQHLWCLVE